MKVFNLQGFCFTGETLKLVESGYQCAIIIDGKKVALRSFPDQNMSRSFVHKYNKHYNI